MTTERVISRPSEQSLHAIVGFFIVLMFEFALDLLFEDSRVIVCIASVFIIM